MDFVINTPLNSLTTEADLTAYIQLLAEQNTALTLRLEVPVEQAEQVRQTVKDAPIEVLVTTAEQPDAIQGDYVMNLRITDRLFPGAVAQIAAVVAAHPTHFVTSAFLTNAADLGHALTDFLTEEYRETAWNYLPPVQAAGLADKAVSTWSVADKLAVLPMIQRYQVFTKNDRFLDLENRLWPFGNVLKVSSLDANVPVTSVAQQIHVLQQATNVIFLGAPILASDRRIITPEKQVDELLAGITVPQTMAFTEQYHPYVIQELQTVIESPAFLALTASEKADAKKHIATSLDAVDGYAASEIK